MCRFLSTTKLYKRIYYADTAIMFCLSLYCLGLQLYLFLKILEK